LKALVTGGAGFIGSHLVDRLVAAGHETWVADDLSTGREDNLQQALAGDLAHFVHMDVTSPALLPLVADIAPDVILHLAAQMDVRKSVADPLHDTKTNVVGTVNTLLAAVGARTAKVVFASSGGTVYGEPEALPVSDDAPLRPASPYGAAKVAAETYVAAFGRLHGFAWTSLALGNVYGPRQNPHGEAGVVAIFGRALLEGRPTLIFGDGSSSRDYIYVDDVVDAFMCCLDERTNSRRFNVGTGLETTVRELHRLVAAACSADDAPEHRVERVGELQHVVLDATALHATTGWTARVSLEDGLAATVAWIATTKAEAAATCP
jgi:UDP-glucose 4-epimerase